MVVSFPIKQLVNKIDNYQKSMGDKTVKAQNDISKALELYELAEEEKEASPSNS